jgi:hypothetical protein
LNYRNILDFGISVYRLSVFYLFYLRADFVRTSGSMLVTYVTGWPQRLSGATLSVVSQA